MKKKKLFAIILLVFTATFQSIYSQESLSLNRDDTVDEVKTQNKR